MIEKIVNVYFSNPRFPPEATLAPHIIISTDKVYKYGFTESINNYNYVIEYRTRLYDDNKQIIKASELADRFIFVEKMI